MKIVASDQSLLDSYTAVPIRLMVDAIYEVKMAQCKGQGLILEEKPLSEPYVDDFDAFDHPRNWAQRGWDLSKWGFYAAYEKEKMVGGAIVAYDTTGVYMLQGRRDIACLWDIRVHPDFRRKGIGKVLLDEAKAFAHTRGCKYLKIETQNTNIRANRFYESQGCVLGGINRYAYEDFPQQVQMLWFYLF